MDMQDLQIEAGFPVTHPLAGKGEIEPGFFPGGKLASLLYTGPYPQMAGSVRGADTIYRLKRIYTQRCLLRKTYYNSPMDVAPEALQTQIIFPLLAK